MPMLATEGNGLSGLDHRRISEIAAGMDEARVMNKDESVFLSRRGGAKCSGGLVRPRHGFTNL